LKKIALFDLDHTLLPIDSDFEWGVFTTRIGWTDPAHFAAQNEAFYADYKAGTLDIAAYVRFATAALVQQGREACRVAHRQFMQEVVQPAFHPAALALVQRHRESGDELVVVTATNEFVTGPIAAALGIDHLIAVKLVGMQEKDANTGQFDWINGEIDGIASAREGKVQRVAQWLSERGLGWQDVDLTFYSDSLNDLPLLEKVNHPVATNPDARLRALAHERQWPVLDLFEKR
jgi:HAD superfamily hydrolase (TIGR01490 family)